MDIGHRGLQLHLNSQYYCLALDKLDLISQTMRAALKKYSRVFMVRFDVHLPRLNLKYSPKIYDSAVIDRFIECLKDTIQKGSFPQGCKGKQAYPSKMYYAWSRHYSDADTDHYHVVIFLNHDVYSHLGDFSVHGYNLNTKIVEAWACALELDSDSTKFLVDYPEDTPVYYLNRNAKKFPLTFDKAFFRLSYLAKLGTKHYEDRMHSFGCSIVLDSH